MAVAVVGKPQGRVPNARRELVDFQKVYIPAGQEKNVSFSVSKDTLRVYLAGEQRWALEAGRYVIEAGSSSEDLPLRCQVELTGETLQVQAPEWYFSPAGEPDAETFAQLYGKERLAAMPKREKTRKGNFTRSNFFFELQDSSFLCRTVLGVMVKGASAQPGSEGQAAALLHTNLDSLADVMGSGIVDGLLLSANGHSFKGLFRMFQKDKNQKYQVSDFITEE